LFGNRQALQYLQHAFLNYKPLLTRTLNRYGDLLLLAGELKFSLFAISGLNQFVFFFINDCANNILTPLWLNFKLRIHYEKIGRQRRTSLT